MTCQELPLLLLHAFPVDARMWRHTIAHFSPSRPVIAPNAADLVSRGETMSAMAEGALAALDGLAPGRRALVVGLSMGGYVAEEFAHRYPDRLGGLVLCDTRTTAETPGGRAGRDAMILAVQHYGVAPATAAMAGKLLHDPSLDLAAEVNRMVDEQDPAVAISCLKAMRDREDRSDTVRRLQVPLLVIAGEHDVFAPRQVEDALAALQPGGRYVEIPRSGHLPPLENPEAFNAALETV